MAKTVEWNDEWLARVQAAVEGLKYGTVQIVVHDGRIVQIERTERFRYETSADSRHAGQSQQAAK
ncbi:YezD family protein [Cohnella candidum]|uniref:DUF2292 domain-containing protein n=1 Tax=Cohnella candidum TaxID=2674991 RepID=A0A3G3JT44_9BACL|nr:YezD family protein [Cohnella candidum]AYQ71395.1 DUF2292 domain-containing protein [Cohnella candidum]